VSPPPTDTYAKPGLTHSESPDTQPRPSPTGLEVTSVAERAFSLVAWNAAVDVPRSEQLCIAGEPVECLALADLEGRSGDVSRDLAQGRAYRERAYSILVLQCRRRNPDACVVIARMHALAIGLPRNPVGEAALLGRARDLCKHRPARVCAAFDP
jgi:hypothetical protein